MSYSIYELIAAYDWKHYLRNSSQVFPVWEWIFDLDRAGAGLCRCEEDGTVALLWQMDASLQKTASELWVQQLRTDYQLRSDVESCLCSDAVYTAMWNYYQSARRMDEIAFSSADGTEYLRASQLDQGFAPIRRALCQVMERGLEELERQKIDEEELRIIPVGVLSGSAPVQFTMRSMLSVSPDLLDPRFVATADWESMDVILHQGEKTLERSVTVGREVSFLWIDAQGKDAQALSLARKDQPVSALEHPVYSQPIFVSASEKLRFRVDTSIVEKSLPYDIGSVDGDLIELACRMGENGPVILLRRSQMPAQVYQI